MFRIAFLLFLLLLLLGFPLLCLGEYEIGEGAGQHCQKFSLPKDDIQFYEHLEKFLELRTGNNPKKDLTWFCHGSESPFIDYLHTMDRIMTELIVDANRREEERKKEKEDWQKKMNEWRKEVEPRPTDCSDIPVNEETKSGVYGVYPYQFSCDRAIEVFCDMETDGGGWTVFLVRMNQSKQLNFTRDWSNYRDGFGSPESEYWLGNENLHRLTSARKYVIRLEAKSYHGRNIWGEWNSFEVKSESNKYELKVDDYNEKSLARDDHLSYHNGMKFSTFDQDYDIIGYNFSCASNRKGGWWYKDCETINPTGVYGRKTNSLGVMFDHWSNFDDTARIADWLQLKIRPAT